MKVFKKRSQRRPDWQEAPDIEKRLRLIVDRLEIDWLIVDNIHCFRSTYTTTRAYARAWGLSRIRQQALHEEPHYIIEVISEKFDKLPLKKQDEVLLHEIAHIPHTFSGALLPHTHGKGMFHDKLKRLIYAYNR